MIHGLALRAIQSIGIKGGIMNKVLFFIPICILIGCAPERPPAFLAVESIEEAAHTAFYDVQDVSDMEQYGHLEYWASPEETFTNMKGDCEDQALLFLRLVYDNFNIKGTMRAYTDQTWEHGHITTVVGGQEYGYQGGDLQYEWCYEEAMSGIGFTKD
jgi:hypothetical protein